MKKGFTMIELIFVIVILGVLAAVAIPKLNATRDDAEQAKAMTNLATLMGDLTSYYTAQGSFQADVTKMTNVPLAVNATDAAAYDYKIKNDTCLTFKADQTNGTLTITSPAESPNPVCNSLIGNTATQNILSGSYTCEGAWKSQAQADSTDKFEWAYNKATDDKGADKDGVMASACGASTAPATTPEKANLEEAIVLPIKMDAFGKTVTMNFQGGGVAF